MKVLDSYSNVKIVQLPGSFLPVYMVKPFDLTEKEKGLLKKYDRLLSEVELDAVRKEPDPFLRKEVLRSYLHNRLPDTPNKDRLISVLINKVIGYGLLSDLIEDTKLEEIMVNGPNFPVFVFHRDYGMCKTNIIFRERESLYKMISRLCWIHNKEAKSIVDISALDGSRVNITKTPLAMKGPTITIRKQQKNFYTITQLIDFKTLDLDLAALLWLAVDGMRISPANLVIAGSVGSGKTTLLNALSAFIPPEERILSIEDTAELDLTGKDNWVPLTTSEEADMDMLLRDTLRMRPDRLIVGEIRGSEAITLFNAMNVGHKGMGTLHSSSPREVIYRLEGYPMNVPSRIVSNLDLILVVNKFLYYGKPVRRVTEVAEVGGTEGDTILLGTIYSWDPKSDKATPNDERTPVAFLDKLSSKTKIKKKAIMEGLNRRKLILRAMVEQGIFDYHDVIKTINRFYIDERELEEDLLSVARSRKSTTV